MSALRACRLAAAVLLLALLALPALAAAQEPAPAPAPLPAPTGEPVLPSQVEPTPPQPAPAPSEPAPPEPAPPPPEPASVPAPPPPEPASAPAPPPPPPAPAPVALTVSAGGVFALEEVLDWDVSATVLPGPGSAAPLEHGADTTLRVRLDATRSTASASAFTGVRGEVCAVSPDGAAAGEARITLRAQAISVVGSYVDLPGASHTILPTLAPGERACHPYEIAFPPALTGAYRLVAGIEVEGHQAGEATAAFALPAPTLQRVDDEAVLAVSVACPPGLACAPAGPPAPPLTEPGAVEVDLVVRNDAAACDAPQPLAITATLTEGDSGTEREATAAPALLTGECPPACALPVAYWRSHTGATELTPDRVTPLLPIALGLPDGPETVTVASPGQALPVLAYEDDRANGVNRLYAQLLAAKLNIARGAPGDAVAATIAAADASLAEHGPGDWLLHPHREAVLEWTAALEAFNSGGGCAAV